MYFFRLGTFAIFSFFAALYLGGSPLFGMWLWNNVLFHPLAYPEGPYGIPAISQVPTRDVFFQTADGLRLHAWYFQKPGARWCVLVCHGNGGNITHRCFLAKALIDSGCSVFLYDYRGYGRSEGKPTLAGVLEDARAAYACLTGKLGVSPDRIILYGESLGGAIACQLSKGSRCAAIILDSTFYSLKDIARSKFHILYLYPDWLMPTPDYNNAAVLREAHPPLLIMHGSEDGILPVDQCRRLAAAAAPEKKLVVFAGVGHNNMPEHEGYFPTIRDFIAGLDSP